MTNLFWFCLELDTFQSCMLLLLHPTMTQLTFMQDAHFKPQYTAQHVEMGSGWFININPVPTFAYMQLQFIAQLLSNYFRYEIPSYIHIHRLQPTVVRQMPFLHFAHKKHAHKKW